MEAYQTVEKLANSVAAPRDMGADIAASLRMVATNSVLLGLQISDKEKNQKPGVVDRVITSLVQACKNGPLPPPSFIVLYPVRVLNYTFISLCHICLHVGAVIC